MPQVNGKPFERLASGALLGFGILLFFAYIIVLTVPAVGLYHDDGIYLVTARALAEGQGYHIISLPESVPQTKYPLIFPALLALVWGIFSSFPENLTILKIVPFAALLGWLFLAHRLLRSVHDDSRMALSCVILSAAAPWILFLSTSLLSETLFALLLFGALLLLRELDRDRLSEAMLVGAAMVAVAAFLTRTIGIVLPLAALLLLLKRGRIVPAARFTLYSGVLAAPWLLWVWRHRGSDDTTAYYAATNYAEWNVLTGFEWSDKLLVVFTNAGQILMAPAFLLGWATWLAQPVLILVSALAVLGFVLHLRKGLDGSSLFLLLYCGILLLWAWRPVRFMAPILPLLLAFAWLGGRALFQYLRLSPSARRLAAALIVGLLLVNSGILIGQVVLRGQSSGIVCPPPGECSLTWKDVENVAAWIRTNTDEDAHLVAHHDPMIYLLTGRRAARAATFDPVSMLYKDPRSALDEMPPCYLIDRMHALGAEYVVETSTGRAYEEWLLAELVDRSEACGDGSLEEVQGAWGSGVRLHRLRD